MGRKPAKIAKLLIGNRTFDLDNFFRLTTSRNDRLFLGLCELSGSCATIDDVTDDSLIIDQVTLDTPRVLWYDKTVFSSDAEGLSLDEAMNIALARRAIAEIKKMFSASSNYFYSESSFKNYLIRKILLHRSDLRLERHNPIPLFSLRNDKKKKYVVPNLQVTNYFMSTKYMHGCYNMGYYQIDDPQLAERVCDMIGDNLRYCIYDNKLLYVDSLSIWFSPRYSVRLTTANKIHKVLLQLKKTKAILDNCTCQQNRAGEQVVRNIMQRYFDLREKQKLLSDFCEYGTAGSVASLLLYPILSPKFIRSFVLYFTQIYFSLDADSVSAEILRCSQLPLSTLKDPECGFKVAVFPLSLLRKIHSGKQGLLSKTVLDYVSFSGIEPKIPSRKELICLYGDLLSNNVEL